MHKTNEDSDMKIVGAVPLQKEDSFDAQQLIEEVKLQRFNGNSAKARTLGANIVSSFSYEAAPEELIRLAAECSAEITPEVLVQIKILSVFSAEYCLEHFLPSPMLSAAAVSKLYDVLEEVSPELYACLSRSLAFSFYCLGIEKADDKSRHVGKQFAMLCGKKGDAPLEDFGSRLHEINMSVYKKAIDGFAFV